MKNLKEMNAAELKAILIEMFDEESVEEIFKLYTLDEITDIINQEKEYIAAMEAATSSKHIVSRKKESNRLKKYLPMKYKKKREKKWIEKRRTTVPNEDINNRAYLNKASKGYTKLQPHVIPKSKKRK